MKTVKQKKTAELIRKTLSDLFRKNGLAMSGNKMMTITEVDVTPDMLIARVYLSLYNISDPEKQVKEMNDRRHEFRGQLGNEIRHQVRHIPDLEFRIDNTLDQVFRLEELFKKNKS